MIDGVSLIAACDAVQKTLRVTLASGKLSRASELPGLLETPWVIGKCGVGGFRIGGVLRVWGCGSAGARYKCRSIWKDGLWSGAPTPEGLGGRSASRAEMSETPPAVTSALHSGRPRSSQRYLYW